METISFSFSWSYNLKAEERKREEKNVSWGIVATSCWASRSVNCRCVIPGVRIVFCAFPVSPEIKKLNDTVSQKGSNHDFHLRLAQPSLFLDEKSWLCALLKFGVSFASRWWKHQISSPITTLERQFTFSLMHFKMFVEIWMRLT